MAQITTKQLIANWKHLPNKFDVNVFNFETLVGNAAVEVFQQSFALRRFNSSGATSWPARNQYAKHPLLYETGALKSSIKVKKRSPKHKVIIYTDDSEFISSRRNWSDPHQYGAKSNRNRDYAFCYAAIHNMGGSAAGATGLASRIKQRQFIGDSTVLFRRIELMTNRLFDGFPK